MIFKGLTTSHPRCKANSLWVYLQITQKLKTLENWITPCKSLKTGWAIILLFQLTSLMQKTLWSKWCQEWVQKLQVQLPQISANGKVLDRVDHLTQVSWCVDSNGLVTWLGPCHCAFCSSINNKEDQNLLKTKAKSRLAKFLIFCLFVLTYCFWELVMYLLYSYFIYFYYKISPPTSYPLDCSRSPIFP